jgi:hypothetical protein
MKRLSMAPPAQQTGGNSTAPTTLLLGKLALHLHTKQVGIVQKLRQLCLALLQNNFAHPKLSFLYNEFSTWPHLRSKHMGKKQSLMGDVYLSIKLFFGRNRIHRIVQFSFQELLLIFKAVAAWQRLYS